jgi:hypothetical protein
MVVDHNTKPNKFPQHHGERALVSLSIQSNTLPCSHMQNIGQTQQDPLHRKGWTCGRGDNNAWNKNFATWEFLGARRTLKERDPSILGGLTKVTG